MNIRDDVDRVVAVPDDVFCAHCNVNTPSTVTSSSNSSRIAAEVAGSHPYTNDAVNVDARACIDVSTPLAFDTAGPHPDRPIAVIVPVFVHAVFTSPAVAPATVRIAVIRHTPTGSVVVKWSSFCNTVDDVTDSLPDFEMYSTTGMSTARTRSPAFGTPLSHQRPQ